MSVSRFLPRRQSDLAFPVLPSFSRALFLIRDSARFSLGHRLVFQRLSHSASVLKNRATRRQTGGFCLSFSAFLSLSLSLSLSLFTEREATPNARPRRLYFGALDLATRDVSPRNGPLSHPHGSRFPLEPRFPLPRKTSTVGIRLFSVGKCGKPSRFLGHAKLAR